MEILTVFKDFGYPALISAALLWILTVKIEKISVYMEHIKDMLAENKREVERNKELVEVNKELLKEIKSYCDEQQRRQK